MTERSHINDLANTYQNRGVLRADIGDLVGGRADFDVAIALRESLRRQLGAEWPPAWAHELAMAYVIWGIVLEDVVHLEDAISNWDRATQICLKLVERGQLQAGAQLIHAISMQVGGYHDLGNWPEAARCLLQFLTFQSDLETQWTAGENSGEPPWRSIIAQFAKLVHELNPEQRAALLLALGEDAERVKGVFGWE